MRQSACLKFCNLQADRDKREAADRIERDKKEAAEAAARQLAEQQAAADAKEANLKSLLERKQQVSVVYGMYFPFLVHVSHKGSSVINAANTCAFCTRYQISRCSSLLDLPH